MLISENILKKCLLSSIPDHFWRVGRRFALSNSFYGKRGVLAFVDDDGSILSITEDQDKSFWQLGGAKIISVKENEFVIWDYSDPVKKELIRQLPIVHSLDLSDAVKSVVFDQDTGRFAIISTGVISVWSKIGDLHYIWRSNSKKFGHAAYFGGQVTFAALFDDYLFFQVDCKNKLRKFSCDGRNCQKLGFEGRRPLAISGTSRSVVIRRSRETAYVTSLDSGGIIPLENSKGLVGWDWKFSTNGKFITNVPQDCRELHVWSLTGEKVLLREIKGMNSRVRITESESDTEFFLLSEIGLEHIKFLG